MEQASRTVNRSRRKLQGQLKRLVWLTETQAALGWGVILFLAAIVGTVYVSQAGRIAATGRHVQQLQARIEDLKRENAHLARDIAEAQSLDRLEADARQLGFVRAGAEDIEFVIVPEYPMEPILPTPTPDPVLTNRPEAPANIREALWLMISTRFTRLVTGESSGP